MIDGISSVNNVDGSEIGSISDVTLDVNNGQADNLNVSYISNLDNFILIFAIKTI